MTSLVKPCVARGLQATSENYIAHNESFVNLTLVLKTGIKTTEFNAGLRAIHRGLNMRGPILFAVGLLLIATAMLASEATMAPMLQEMQVYLGVGEKLASLGIEWERKWLWTVEIVLILAVLVILTGNTARELNRMKKALLSEQARSAILNTELSNLKKLYENVPPPKPVLPPMPGTDDIDERLNYLDVEIERLIGMLKALEDTEEYEESDWKIRIEVIRARFNTVAINLTRLEERRTTNQILETVGNHLAKLELRTAPPQAPAAETPPLNGNGHAG